MATTKPTNNDIALTRSTDANNWVVYDYGTWKEYRKRVTFSQSVSTGPVTFTISSTTLPVGISNLGGSTFFNYSVTANGFSGGLVVVGEATAATTTINFTASSTDATRTYTGFIDLLLVGY